MASVTFPPDVGGDGSTVSDDSNSLTGLGNGGHRSRFVAALVQMVAVAEQVVAKAQAAAASAQSALNAPGTTAASTTSLAVGTGSKSLTIQTGKALAVGGSVIIASTASPANRMGGVITAYNAGTGALTVNVVVAEGSGTFAAWTVSLGVMLLMNNAALTGAPTAPTAAPGTNTTQLANTSFVQSAIAALVASSPAALDTLNELAAALGNDANFATTMTTALAGKQPLDGTLTALAALTTAANQLIYSTGADTFAMAALTPFARTLLDDVDAAAARATLAAAPLANAALTGTPSAPTAAPGTSTTQLANTAFVQAAIAALVASSPAALDTLNELAAALGNDANFATTMTTALAGKQAAMDAASKAEMEAGTETALRSMSPVRIKEAIAALGKVLPSITGTYTTNGSTDNRLTLTGIVAALGLEVGDVILIGGAAAAGNKKLYTVESITDANNIIVNYEHAGNRGDGSLRLVNQTSISGVTIQLVAKWFNAPRGLGKEYVNVAAKRGIGVSGSWGATYLAPITRGATDVMVSCIFSSGSSHIDAEISSAFSIKSTGLAGLANQPCGITFSVPSGGDYRLKTNSTAVSSVVWIELR